jgi:hypothetical protein
MSVVAHAWDFALYRPILERFFILCDILSYIRHDNRFYTIVMCKLLEIF